VCDAQPGITPALLTQNRDPVLAQAAGRAHEALTELLAEIAVQIYRVRR
jgi:hypothetical protein